MEVVRARSLPGAINSVTDFELSDAGGDEGSRERYLSESELRALFRAMRESVSFGRPNELAVKLLLVLCVRKLELLSALWSDFDLDAGFWRLPDNKSTRPIDIPLPALALEWLQELSVLACGSDYVFPDRWVSKRKRVPHVGTDTRNRALDSLDHDIPPFTVHDLRRTARTHMARLGISSHIAERGLNHKIKGVEGTYDRHDYFEDRRATLELWALEIEALSRTDNKVEVVALRA